MVGRTTNVAWSDPEQRRSCARPRSSARRTLRACGVSSARRLVCAVLLAVVAANDEALQHLLAGNDFAAQGEHQQAIDAWTAAAALRPDSNVPHNNIANAYLSLDRVDSALTVAQQAFGLKADYMTSVTLSNVHKRRKDFREAERVLLQGVAATEKSDEPHEHPFWSLASLYWDQGDYREYLRLAHLGIKHKSPSSCQPDARPPCALPAFEVDIIDKLCNASLDVGRYTCAGGDAAGGDAVLQSAENVARRYSLSTQASALQDARRECGRRTTAAGHAPDDLMASRYARMVTVRVMGCDWRDRAHDQRIVAQMLAASEASVAALAEVGAAVATDGDAYLFECQDGLVCGAGSQPPLHLWALNVSLQDVRTMGAVQARVLLAHMHAAFSRNPPLPSFRHDLASWVGGAGGGSGGGLRRLHVGIISSDLLRDHPVGNMMRDVLPLHDLSRQKITVFLIHEHQRHAAQQPENKHLVGDVHLVMLGRGPHVLQQWDSDVSVRGAAAVNAGGVCILIDLIGYTSDHRQDVMALRPAPLQVSYHGYMGTTGADYIDYYIADRVLAPVEHSRFFSEHLVMMPECFLGPSHRLSHQLWGVSGGSRLDYEGFGEDDVSVRRMANGLPPTGALVCNFNQHFKIDSATFDRWCHVVARLGGTLWLLRGTPGIRA